MQLGGRGRGHCGVARGGGGFCVLLHGLAAACLQLQLTVSLQHDARGEAAAECPAPVLAGGGAGGGAHAVPGGGGEGGGGGGHAQVHGGGGGGGQLLVQPRAGRG